VPTIGAAAVLFPVGHTTSAPGKRATFNDRFDAIDERLTKEDRRLETIADRLLAAEKKATAIDRRLDGRGANS
jgi:hypothetical protein